MKRFMLVLFLIAGALPVAAPAHAEHNPNGKRLKFEDCLEEDGSYAVPPDCTYDEDGHIIEPSTHLTRGGGGLGGFFVFAALWSLIPPFIAATIASERGQSVGLAVVVSIFFGWLGLAFVYFMMRDDPTFKVATVTPSGAASAPRAASGDPTTRLQKLQGLLDEELISEEEFKERRRAILGEV